jgi:choline dehydrogenase-like flavoprotein
MQREEHLLNHSLHAHLVSDVHDSAGYLALRRLAEAARARTVRGASVPADLWEVTKASPQLATFAARRLARKERPTSLVVIDQMEQEPDPSSRVTVDHDRTDRFGLPRVQLDWRIAESTYSSQRRMHQLFASIVTRAGVPDFRSALLDHPAEPVPLIDMKHPSGTTRMSYTPRDGVVDANCQVHGIANLFIAGSSIFPTVGHANPTLTIVALAARLAHHLGGPAADTLA